MSVGEKVKETKMLIPGSHPDVIEVAPVPPSLISNILITGMGQGLMVGIKVGTQWKNYQFWGCTNISCTDIIFAIASVLFIFILIGKAQIL